MTSTWPHALQTGRWELDETSAVLTEKRLTELYATTMETVAWRDTRLFIAAG
jgi:hypothetical protein